MGISGNVLSGVLDSASGEVPLIQGINVLKSSGSVSVISYVEICSVVC